MAFVVVLVQELVQGKGVIQGIREGDPVNLASRLQSLTRQYGALILGSEHVLRQIPDMSKYAYREVDIVQVKGKTEAVAVYEFFDGDPEQVRSQKRMAVEPFMPSM